MAGAVIRLGAVYAAVIMLAGSGAWALPAAAASPSSRLTVELEKDSCAGPVAAVLASPSGAVVFHHMEAGRYVISLPAEAASVRLAVLADTGAGQWIPARMSAVSNGRRYAIGEDGQRIVVAVPGADGEIHIRLEGL